MVEYSQTLRSAVGLHPQSGIEDRQFSRILEQYLDTMSPFARNMVADNPNTAPFLQRTRVNLLKSMVRYLENSENSLNHPQDVLGNDVKTNRKE